ncbi:hypothetical protein WA577_003713, partial [Blastocystis sp. JDR]
MRGFLNLYKPRSVTSAFCLNWLKKKYPIQRLGHTGTLDALAEGVLVVAMGSSTKLIPYLPDSKTYLSTFRFGQTSPSLDLNTPVRISASAETSSITRQAVEQALPLFVGTIQQAVPTYSAVKWKGSRLSDLAREGLPVVSKSRPVRIDSIDLLDYTPAVFPEVTLRIRCGSGTYIRSLCRDLAHSLQSEGVVTQLVREECHGLMLKESVNAVSIRGGG